MNDDAFLAALESCRLSPSDFNHEAHVRAGYLYLRRFEFTEALAAMRRAINAFAASIGKSSLYHETITTAFMILIAERLADYPEDADWPSFLKRNADLVSGNPLRRHYSPERLATPLARRIFLMPDRAGGTDKAA